MHVLDGLEELVDIEFDPVLWQVVCPSLDGFIEVHLHQLEDQGQSACWLVIEHLN